MDQSEFRTLLHRYQTGSCTDAEKRRIEAWYTGLGAERRLQLSPDERTALEATVWQRIADRTILSAAPDETSLLSSRPVAGRFGWASVGVRWAAVAVFALGAGLASTYWGRGLASRPASAPAGVAEARWVVYRNNLAHDTRVALPDGSAVTLTPASQLKYPRAFTGARRTVYLTGEAFFEVFHDDHHPFSVYTEQVVTTVLGTTFRVRAYAGQAEAQVQVRTGAVRVSPRTAGATALAAGVVVRPNQQAVYSVGRGQLRRELVPQPALLAPQAFVFDDRPVAEVLTALQKAYGIAIEYDAAALHHCTLNLSLGQEPLFEKLDIICQTLGASYEKADGRILFHSQPCPAE
ncbi:FecR family protein [Hymenobacter antarcticus]|uniref:FecR family protein n=1 Tax=Hymenobacter antarcticus TaxID=486270 RepID=A0ABP7PLI4_9BACT